MLDLHGIPEIHCLTGFGGVARLPISKGWFWADGVPWARRWRSKNAVGPFRLIGTALQPAQRSPEGRRWEAG